MKIQRTLLFCAGVFSLGAAMGFASGPDRELVVTKSLDSPILTTRSPGAEGNKYGFEGGSVLKVNGAYHLFTSEMVANPEWVKMKLGHWVSPDAIHWTRRGTVFESSGNFTGEDPRAALWAPMPVFSAKENRWNVFYVAYHCAPDTPTQWLNNTEGEIWRAVSRVSGMNGIDGPYKDAGVILKRGKDSDSWEGLQGTDSLFPYQVGNEWYGFYGSAHTEALPISSWQVGLVKAPSLAGPWKRCTELNPLKIEGKFTENPVVTRLKDGTYVAVYDTDVQNAIGYTFSRDGVHWSDGQHLIVQKDSGIWASDIRTPLGLVPEGNDSFTLLYTAFEKGSGAPAAASSIPPSTAAVGMVKVHLQPVAKAAQAEAKAAKQDR